jgi:hypothetical protein
VQIPATAPTNFLSGAVSVEPAVVTGLGFRVVVLLDLQLSDHCRIGDAEFRSPDWLKGTAHSSSAQRNNCCREYRHRQVRFRRR